ncbi:MAG: hypothetical protein FGM32_00595 [Candidatus Kapabacteria bacterium]|nr:hypothetical protein [Candidatus Kapabacteria bacterium]
MSSVSQPVNCAQANFAFAKVVLPSPIEQRNVPMSLRSLFSVIAAAMVLVITHSSVRAGTVNSTNPRVDGLIANVGQWPAHVLFLSRQQGVDVWITRFGVEVDKYGVDVANQMRNGRIERRTFVNADPRARVSSVGAVSRVNFFRGRGESEWFSAPVYSIAVVHNVVPGADVRYSVGGDGLRQDVVLRPGAERSALMVEIDDDASTRSNVTPATSVVYGSYLGGTGTDLVAGLEYLSNGDVIIAGSTTSMEYSGATGGYSRSLKGLLDGFLARMDRKLQKVLSFSFYGGSGEDKITSIIKDRSNNVYVTGETNSPDLPVTSGASGQLYKAGIDAYIAKFDSTLNKLIVSGYHGGNKDDRGVAIAADQNGVIFIAGNTTSTLNLPVTFPVTATRRDWRGRTTTEPGGGGNQGLTDIFLAFFSATGTLQQSRYFGREGVDLVTAMCIDASNSVYFTGSTTSPNFETAPTSGFFASGRLPYDRVFNGGNTDAFVVKLNNELALAKSDDGTYSTYFGGSGDETGRGIFVDEQGRAQVVGVTTSTNLDCVGTLITQRIGGQDLFLAVFSDDGQKLAGATYFGGTGNDEAYGVRYNTQNKLAVMYGATQSNDFPAAGEGATNERAGTTDGFVALLNTSTNVYTTLISGADADSIMGLATEPAGDLYYAMSTTSDNFRTPDSAAQGKSSGQNVFVGKYAYGTIELTAPLAGETWCAGSNKAVSWGAQGMPDTTKYSIELAPTGTTNWTVVTRVAQGRSFSWKVPNVPTGQYHLRLTTSRGHMSRLISPFIISNPPAISSQPKDASACPGGQAVMRLKADGAGLKYQWRRGGQNISGATADSIVVTVDAGTLGRYDCVVTGTCNPSITSASVNLTTAAATAITRQPAGLTVQSGSPFTLSVAATGSTLSYQWSRNSAPISGATSADYTVSAAEPADAGDYTCTVTGGCGAVTSDKAAIVVEGTSVDEDSDIFSSARVVGRHPVADEAVVRIELSMATDLSVAVMDLRGRVVETLATGGLTAGTHDVAISTKNCQSGLHVLKIISTAGTWTLPLTVVR